MLLTCFKISEKNSAKDSLNRLEQKSNKLQVCTIDSIYLIIFDPTIIKYTISESTASYEDSISPVQYTLLVSFEKGFVNISM